MEIRGKPDELDRVAHVIGVPICRPTDRSSHDSSLEGAGFELPVPRPERLGFHRYGGDRLSTQACHRAVASLGKPIEMLGGHSTGRRSPAKSGGVGKGGAVGDANASRNRKFESIPLQRRVMRTNLIGRGADINLIDDPRSLVLSPRGPLGAP